MIHIQIAEKNQECIKVTVKGHAGYAGEGQDIICAAVSILMVNTVNSIETFTDDDFTCDDGDGFMEITVDEEASPGTKLLMRSLCLGLEGIRQSYGDTFIQIMTKEV